MKRWIPVIAFVCVLTFLIIEVAVSSVAVKVNNEYPGKNFNLSRFWTNVFLLKEGYWGKQNKVEYKEIT